MVSSPQWKRSGVELDERESNLLDSGHLVEEGRVIVHGQIAKPLSFMTLLPESWVYTEDFVVLRFVNRD